MIILSILVAMVLRSIALPPGVLDLSPDWVLLTCLYWCFTAPHRFGMWNAWLIGLFTDVLTGKVLGQQALAYTLSAFFSISLKKQFRLYAPMQQALVILALTFSAGLVVFTIDHLRSAMPAANGSFWLSCLCSALVWLLFSSLLRKLSWQAHSRP